MAGLSTALSIASGALSAAETEIDVTDNNIANATTAGYTRETVDLSASEPIEADGVSIGTGVTVESVESIRDALISAQVQQQTSAQSSATAQQNSLTTVQSLFPDSGSGIGTAMSSFLSSLSALSASPANASDREDVIDDASNLADAFHTVASGLTTEQTSLNAQVAGDVTQVNQLTAQIAALNPQIAVLQVEGQDGGSLEDHRSELETQLSQLANVSVISTGAGDTVTTGNGTPLVVGSQSYALSTATNSSGMTAVLDSSGNDITASLSGGDLGGSITARDTTIAGILSQVNTLAYNVATAINSAQSQGYDLSGNAGGALFTVPASPTGAAAAIALRTTNPDAIAASSNGSSGSSGNVSNLTSVQTTAAPGGSSPTDAYAGIVDTVGNAVADATSESSAVSLSLTQLTNQQSSVSGVSTDEEASNLIRFQQAYEAAAEVVTTLQSLMTTTMDMMGNT